MKNFVLTGTPGSGKTVLIRYLESNGYNVVEEAATDVIRLAQACGDLTPWNKPDFLEKIVRLQIQRRKQCAGIQFFDRSPFCTLALAEFLGYPPPPILLDEINLVKKEHVYQRKVFFIENLGHCQPTEARKITFEDALRFEKVHQAVYHAHGFTMVRIANQPVHNRAQLILSAIDPSGLLNRPGNLR